MHHLNLRTELLLEQRGAWLCEGGALTSIALVCEGHDTRQEDAQNDWFVIGSGHLWIPDGQ